MNGIAEKKLYERPGYLKNLRNDNVWLKIAPLISDQINLSLGFPNFVSYPEIFDAYAEALAPRDHVLHQYSRFGGHPRLVYALAAYFKLLMDRDVEPMGEILVTPGTDFGIYLVLKSILSEKDEIILLEPFYLVYNLVPCLGGAKPVYVQLKLKPDAQRKGYTTSADWAWDDAQLEAAFTPRTKAIVICTPSNPLGKVLTPEELNKIASLCIKHNVICVADEVYHQMVYEKDLKHTSIATLPGMWERTLTLGSAGKLLSTTGLKLGWIVGDKRLIHNCNLIFMLSAVTTNVLSQEVVAIALEKEIERYNTPESYFNRLKQEAREKRDFMVKQLIDFGLAPTMPEAGYFIIADISKLAQKICMNDNEPDLPLNVQFVRYLVKKGVVFLPCSAFFSEENKDFHSNYVRICFYKKEETLLNAVKVLKSIEIE